MKGAAGEGQKEAIAKLLSRAGLAGKSGAKPSDQALDAAHENFERLTTMTAQRVVRFWQVRPGE